MKNTTLKSRLKNNPKEHQGYGLRKIWQGACFLPAHKNQEGNESPPAIGEAANQVYEKTGILLNQLTKEIHSARQSALTSVYLFKAH
ncbi:hypothetical protein [Ferruginibacter sp. SUN106]|uniref:hypothetical protein n=1 Tax=Ferruginibacter sp. SUN106 TaxID=2978348 RepID=UPI003D35FA8E